MSSAEMNTPVRLAVQGAAGRMGRRVIALASADPSWCVAAALESTTHAELGNDAGQLAGVGALRVPIASALKDDIDVLIDFSTPYGAQQSVEICRDRRIPLVLATTGLEAAQFRVIDEAAREIPVLWSPSMSLSVNLAMKLSQLAAQTLCKHAIEVDVEIIERHHRHKEDAPSGTALRFGELISTALGLTSATHGRQGRPGARPSGEIGYHAVRAGDNPGEHTIVFGLPGETLEIAVKASNRDCYAQGALAAARYLLDKPPGRYAMADVLGLG